MELMLPDTRYSLLFRLANNTDGDAWDDFVTTYETAVFRYARRRGLQDADAREIVQQVLVAVYQAAAEWKPTDRKGSFRSWLIETAHRLCLQSLRSRQRFDRAAGGSSVIDRLQEVADGSSLAESCDSASTFEQRDWAFCWAAARVEREVDSTTWQAFWRTAVEQVAPDKVAEELKIKIGSVYVAKCRVLARIRERARGLDREEL